jgi:hypothetical protein
MKRVAVMCVLVSLLILGAVMPPYSSADEPVTVTAEHSNLHLTLEDMQRRGKELRAAIDQHYHKLSQIGKLTYDNTIDDLVLKDIPIGMSFDNAEQILRTAGFKVEPRPPVNPPGTRSDRYDVVASIVPYLDAFPSRTSIYVSLSPESPGDYKTISRLSASITISMP